MFSRLVIRMLNSFELLEASCQQLAASMHEDSNLPLVLYGIEGPANRPDAIAAVTRLLKLEDGETVPIAGVVCCSPTTIENAEALNAAKFNFQEAIKEFREKSKSLKGAQNIKLERLIERVLHEEGVKSDELELALKRTKLTDLDLLRCYAKVRILPAHLASISWTWAKTHSAIESISHADALKMAERLTGEAREVAERLLSELPSNTKLAYKKALPNQLRANLIIINSSGGYVRQAVTFSGVALSPDSKLPPTLIWRDNPSGPTTEIRKSRIDAEICTEPYIKALHLHLYAGGIK